MTNPTARIVARRLAAEGRREGETLVFTHRFPQVKQSFYVRVRGANTDVELPRMDTATVDPWDDLWFYSNPIMIRNFAS